MKEKKPRHYNTHTADEMIEALVHNQGIISYAALELGCTYNTLWIRIRDNPKIKEAMLLAKKTVTDLAKKRLLEKIDKGESWAVQFWLKTQARDEGFGEKVQVDMASINLDIELEEKLSKEELRDLYEKIKSDGRDQSISQE